MTNSRSSSSSALPNLAKDEPRRILRGQISDEFGDGEWVFTRLEQRGFESDVEFVAGENGIVAQNTIAALDVSQNYSAVDGQQDDQLLEYRYSVIPDNGCEIEYLKISIDVSDVEISQLTLALTWRGERSARIRVLEPGNAGDMGSLNNRILRQNEVLDISQLSAAKSRWHVEVPSHTLSMKISANGKSTGDNTGLISVTGDAVFLQKNRVWKNVLPGQTQTGTGRIQPEKVLDIIEKAERKPKPFAQTDDQLTSSNHEEAETDNGPDRIGDEPLYSISGLEPYCSSSAYIDVIISQKIELYHGEDIILSTFGLFEDKIKDDASYVSASLPDWIFLDQRSGDLMGTVPAGVENAENVEFSIYAVDGQGNSAKAIIPIEWRAQKFPAGASLVDLTFYEGSTVSIPTIGMFLDFGLDVNGLKFAGEGLPEGLSVNRNDGLVKGMLTKGSANGAPYNIVITASEPADVGSGISMQFLLDVNVSDQLSHPPNDFEASDAMKNLYRMNRQSERLIAANMIGELDDLADGFSLQEMPLTGNNLPPEDIDYTIVPTIQLFTPDRNLYLQVQKDDEVDKSDYNYGAQLADQKELPDWIECSSNGFISIKCAPDRRFVDLELIQQSGSGTIAEFDICIDTFDGSMMPMHRNSETFTEKQIRQLSTA